MSPVEALGIDALPIPIAANATNGTVAPTRRAVLLNGSFTLR